MARPTKYTPERAAKVIAELRDGMTRTVACAQAGVCYDTFLNWRRRFLGFLAQVEAAEAEAEARYTEVIAKAAFGHEVIKTRRTTRANGEVEETVETSWECSWKAALEWLKRRRRKDWGITSG